MEDEVNDEFAKYFNGLPPKVAITTKEHSTKVSVLLYFLLLIYLLLLTKP